MKKFIVIMSTLIILYFIFDLCFYRLGFFINFNYNDITYNVKQEGKKIWVLVYQDILQQNMQ